METINGEFYMMGCKEDAPGCLHSLEDLRKLIQCIGFIPLFSNNIKGFSVEEHTPTYYWWTGNPETDPWEWRQSLSRDPEIAYGKFFDRKAGFISKEWFPVFANYRRNGYDFDALCDDELVPYRNKKLMEAFELDDKLCGLELFSYEVKQKAGFGKDGQKNFEGVQTELQMQTYLLINDFRQKKNKKGQEYGWHIAVLETPETKWGYNFITQGYKEQPLESWKKIVAQVKKNYPDAEDKNISKLLGIRYPGEVIAENKPAKIKPKPEKKLKPHQRPYPECLIHTLGVDGDVSEDQYEGLKYVLEDLKQMEREIVRLRYEEHLSYRKIGEKINRSLERVRSLLNRAIKKMSQEDKVPFYRDGYVKTLIYLQEEKEQSVKEIMNKISQAGGDPGVITASVYDMKLSKRVTNCLINAGLNTIGDILALIAKDPDKLIRIRNLGQVGLSELISKFDRYGIEVDKLI